MCRMMIRFLIMVLSTAQRALADPADVKFLTKAVLPAGKPLGSAANPSHKIAQVPAADAGNIGTIGQGAVGKLVAEIAIAKLKEENKLMALDLEHLRVQIQQMEGLQRHKEDMAAEERQYSNLVLSVGALGLASVAAYSFIKSRAGNSPLSGRRMAPVTMCVMTIQKREKEWESMVPKAAMLPQRATGPRRSPSPRNIATMEPQTPQVATSRTEADRLFADVVSRCERVFINDFEAFLEVPDLLRDVFDADFRHFVEHIRPAAASQNVSCQRPVSANHRRFTQRPAQNTADRSGNGILTVATEPGRVCCDDCASECSRVVVPQFATDAECAELCMLAEVEVQASQAPQPPQIGRFHSLTILSFAGNGMFSRHVPLSLNANKVLNVKLVLLFVRLVERLRRAVAYEYGLPLASVAPSIAWVFRCSRGYRGQNLHADEASEVHYSSVLYLSTQGDEFEGGDFVFSDRTTAAGVSTAETSPLAPDAIWEVGRPSASTGKAMDGRLLTRLKPLRGRATIFTSGFENLHFVDEVTSGVRYSMPLSFTAYEGRAREGPEDLLGEVSREAVADVLLQQLVVSPEQGGRDKDQSTVRWHTCFAAPLQPSSRPRRPCWVT